MEDFQWLTDGLGESRWHLFASRGGCAWCAAVDDSLTPALLGAQRRIVSQLPSADGQFVFILHLARIPFSTIRRTRYTDVRLQFPYKTTRFARFRSEGENNSTPTLTPSARINTPQHRLRQTNTPSAVNKLITSKKQWNSAYSTESFETGVNIKWNFWVWHLCWDTGREWDTSSSNCVPTTILVLTG